MIKNFFVWVLFFATPNIFWQSVSLFLGVNRDIINVDYLFVLFILRHRMLFVCAFTFVSFFDFLNLFSQVFAFIKVSDLFYLLKFFFMASLSNITLPVFFIFFVVWYVVFFGRKIDFSDRLSPLILMNCTLILLVVYNSTNVAVEDNRPWRIVNKRYMSSQLLNTYELRGNVFDEKKAMDTQDDHAFYDGLIPSASQEIINQKDKYSKYLLIVNESWGVAPNNIQNDILSGMFASQHIKLLYSDILSVNGFTINGEVRELCQKGLKDFNIKDKKIGFEHCLPKQYQKMSYHTISLHGATKFMYERDVWYPKVGFQSSFFQDSFPNVQSRCFSFPGMCDRDLIPFISHVFANSEKLFFYWLTLNSHINYDLRDLKINAFDCNKYKIDAKSSSCRNLKLQKQFFYYLEDLISRPEMKGVFVVVVGDHAPPVYGNDKSIFVENKVPMLRFIVE